MYLFCVSAPHPDRMWATLSGALPHSLHHVSPSELVWIFWLAYNRVGNSCSYSSNLPAIVCVGQDFHSVSHQKHPLTLNFSSCNLVVTRLPYHRWLRTSSSSFSTRHLSTSVLTLRGCSRWSSTPSSSVNPDASLTQTSVSFPPLAHQTPAPFVWPGLHYNRV